MLASLICLLLCYVVLLQHVNTSAIADIGDVLYNFKDAYYIQDMQVIDVFPPLSILQHIQSHHKSDTNSGSSKVCMTSKYIKEMLCNDIVLSESVTHRYTIPLSNTTNTIHRGMLLDIYWYSSCSSSSSSDSDKFKTVNSIAILPTRPYIPSHIYTVDSAYGVIVSDGTLTFRYLSDDLHFRYGSYMQLEIYGSTTSRIMKSSVSASTSYDAASFLYITAGIEPGSWYYRVSSYFTIVDTDSNESQLVEGYPSTGYVEVVLANELINSNRYFPSSTIATTATTHAYTSTTSATIGTGIATSKFPINVCIWGNNALDGQKSIWLLQMESMDKSKFQFTYVLTDQPKNSSTTAGATATVERDMEDIIKYNELYKHVKLTYSPFGNTTITAVQLKDVQNFNFSDENYIYVYLTERLKFANNNIDDITPIWARNLYLAVANSLRDNQCDVLVFGNIRNNAANRLLTQTANILKIPTVSELLTLFVDAGTSSTYIVGPSHYSINHPSIVNATLQPSGATSKMIVISPSVNMDRFYKSESSIGSSSSSSSSRHPYYNIGFIARLSAEKNVGLFIKVAKYILNRNKFVRFTVIGDGSIREHLYRYSMMLGIDWAITFTGWVDTNQLPTYLNTIDILINPSIRAWSETFCITNIEAMAMGVPLVTFAVGGVGEYIVPDDSDTNPTITNGYTIGKNAIIINEASPAVIGDAIELLMSNVTLRTMITKNAYETVVSYYTVDRQMKQYTDLYLSLVTN